MTLSFQLNCLRVGEQKFGYYKSNSYILKTPNYTSSLCSWIFFSNYKSAKLNCHTHTHTESEKKYLLSIESQT